MSIGERLKEERERLEFTQPAFAGLAETTKKSQIDYEKDLTQPKAGYLAAIARVGADVQYIITGERSASALSPEELELLGRYREAPLQVKAAVIGALTAGTTPPTPPATTYQGSQQIFHKAVKGDVAGRDIVKKK